MPRKLIFSLLMVVSAISLQAEVIGETNGTNATATTDDRVAILTAKRQAIQTYPAGLIMGNLALNYEKLLSNNQALFFEGNYMLNGSYGAGFHYRFHYYSKQRHVGLNSPFFGVFIKNYLTKGTASETDGSITNKYDYVLRGFAVGGNWGRRWVWTPGISLDFRIGLGIPINQIDWKPITPENATTMETVVKVASAIDGELSLGWAF